MISEISVIPGRIHFRLREVYGDALKARYINSYISCLYGVVCSKTNHTTGSILIVYDAKKTNHNLLSQNIESAIASMDYSTKEKKQNHELYYKTIEKKDKVKWKFLFFDMLYLLLKVKHYTIGKFSISKNIAALEAASAVTIIGGYPLLKKLYKKFSSDIPTDSDILLKLIATSFTILRESSKGVLVLILKSLSEYIKYSAEVQCIQTLTLGMGKTAEMIWTAFDNDEQILVPVSTLSIGDIVYIHKGEVSPINGDIISGTAIVDSLYTTGQPIASQVTSGEKIQEGQVIVFGDLKIKMQSSPMSFTKKDISLDNLNIHKKVGAYQNKITKAALALAGLNYIFTGNMLNALSLLLVLTPSATATALSHGMKNYIALLKNHNIYLRNPNTFENIINTNNIMFDKTGTLTYGHMKIVKIESFNNSYSTQELLKICDACESNNYHPISIKLQNHVSETNDVSKLKSSVIIPSQGIESVYDNHKLLIGNMKFFENKNIDFSHGIGKYNKYEQLLYYPIFIAIDNKLVGIISMEDEIRNNVHLLIDKLKYRGIKNISLLTGDTYEKSCSFAKSLGIEKVYAECSCEDKLSVISEAGRFGTIMMVGDGINDIDAMKSADVSISFTSSACDKIKLHSDCIIFDDNAKSLADLIYMSQKSYKFIKQNIVFSQFYNIAFGALSFFQYFDAFTAKSLNTINSLIVLLLNERIRWIVPDKMFEYELNENKKHIE